MIRNTTKKQKIGWVLFIVYMAAVVYFMFFAESFDRPDVRQEYHYNLILFREIKRFIIYRDQLGMKAVFLNIVGNAVGFMPFGFFLPIVSRRSRRWYNTVLFGFSFSLAIEITQLVWKVGSFDVDDILLNTIGAALGFIVYRKVQRYRRRKMDGKRAKSE